MKIKVQYTKLLIAMMLLAVTTPSLAEVEEDGRYWLSIYTQGHLPANNWYWSMDLHPRWRDEGKHFDTLIVRPALFYKLSAKSSVWLGYDTHNNHPASKQSFQENRLWEQWMYQFDPIGKVSVSSRTRFEQRDRDDYSDVAHRFRQMVRLSMP